MEKSKKKSYAMPSQKGRKRTPESRKKMSDAKIGKPSNHSGHPHSDETKERMCKVQTARVRKKRRLQIIVLRDLIQSLQVENEQLKAIINQSN